MESHQLDELTRELRAQGYPRSYIARLRDELRDHLASAVEEGQTEEAAQQQLGEHSVMVDAVDHFPDLKSWPQRFPLATFVILPGCLLSAFTVAFVFTAARLAHEGIFTSATWNQFAIRNFQLISTMVTTILAGWLCVAAIRARLHVIYLAAALLLVAANGLFVIDLAQCAQSGGCLAHSRFGFDLTRFSIPFGVFGIGAFFLLRRERLPWQVVARIAGIAVLFLALFALTSDVAARQVRRHPADNLIEGLNSDTGKAHFAMDMLQTPSSLSGLGIDANQAAKIDQLVEQWHSFSQQAIQDWQVAQPSSVGFADFQRSVLDPKLLETKQGVEDLLRASQRTQFQHQVYREMGWRALFLYEVSQELSLTSAQRRQLKDRLVNQVRRRQTPSPCPTTILSERQRRQLATLQGQPIRND